MLLHATEKKKKNILSTALITALNNGAQFSILCYRDACHRTRYIGSRHDMLPCGAHETVHQ